MRKSAILYILIVVVTAGIAAAYGGSGPAYAEGGAFSWKVEGVDSYDGASFHAEVNGKGELEVRCDLTEGTDEPEAASDSALAPPLKYYTALIRLSHERNLSSCGGVAFRVTNRGSGDGSVSPFFCDAAGRGAGLKQGGAYLTEPEGTDGFKYLKRAAVDGVVLAPGESEGFRILFSELGTEQPDYSGIEQFGYFVTLADGERLDLVIGPTEWMGRQEAESYAASLDGAIEGEDVLQIAVEGESLLSLKLRGEGFRFLPLSAEGKGVLFSPQSGRLVATNEAEEQTITVLAGKEGSPVVLAHDVRLYRSWREGEQTAVMARFPNPKTTARPDASYLWFFTGWRLFVLRLFILGTLLLPCIIYLNIRRRAKKQKGED